MSRFVWAALALSLILASAQPPARAQWYFPMGYGGYGYSKWGADPGSGYMAALGSYGRSQGAYMLEKAKADAINVDTMVKWNRALRARQAQLRQDRERELAQKEAEREARVARREAEDGITLNRLLTEILDSDPTVVKASRSKTPLSPDAIREIPFEWDSEAITLCLDEMTASGGLPQPLMGPAFEQERSALRAAVSPAIAEDLKGDISPDTLAHLREAVAKFKAGFEKKLSEFDPGYQDARDYLTTLDSLSRLLKDPSMRAFLKQLDGGEERTVGDLIAFMNAYNLRFGPATTQRQVDLYRRLIPALAEIRDAAVAARTGPATPPAPDGSNLRAAAKDAFRGMDWKELEAHDRAR
ncbi:hypothetical protein OJF2_20080 [Aquisphaera giovannonii]|uniref:Uncharacterized protein n=1 Tax=Aquisphaera giovannonii TaxID=406548 RepID=A0A5B9VYR8_9BACT|nr:hypothetical protein [Aquisphaera giovannonii]QEH33506.1 hypothetical protein OJF2_20080 [Aquisphaera giovannonii]